MAKAQTYKLEIEPEDEGSGDHPEVEDIGKFFTGELTGKACREVEQHLAGCDRCRQELATHVRLASVAVSEEELQRLDTLPRMSLDDQVAHILRQFPATYSSRRFSARSVLEWLEDALVSPILAPALAVALLVVVSLASLQMNNVYQQRRLEKEVAQGYAVLQEGWFVTTEDFRPSGGFPPAVFSRERGPVINSAELAFQQALRRAPDSREARLGLAVFYSFSGQIFLADSVLQILLARDSTDNEAWNQRGLVQARAQNHEAALAAFATALRHRPSYAEAAFNRAQLLTQLQRKPEALQAWQAYLQLDAASPWAEAARAKIKNFETP